MTGLFIGFSIFWGHLMRGYFMGLVFWDYVTGGRDTEVWKPQFLNPPLRFRYTKP